LKKIEERAGFDIVRYSQVWEDADLLLKALDINKNDTVLSIASAGDNAFALLSRSPKAVYAVDLSFPQIACCELRKVMYKELSYQEHLVFGGVCAGDMDREEVFHSLTLPADVKNYWSTNIDSIRKGFMTIGKFEKYFALFRNKVLPIVHNKKRIDELLISKSKDERKTFYDKKWNNLRWKLLFRIFFSRFVMGRKGRDVEFFKYVEGSVSDRILSRTVHALTHLDPAENPYLHFILKGSYSNVLPFSLREENYENIKQNLDNIYFNEASIQDFITGFDGNLTAFNLSDIFEYMTETETDELYSVMLEKTGPGARFAYWNMLAPRKCSDEISKKYNVYTNEEQNANFLAEDKAFFYSKFYLILLTEHE